MSVSLRSRFLRATLVPVLLVLALLSTVIYHLTLFDQQQQSFYQLDQLRHSRNLLLTTDAPPASWRVLRQRLPGVQWHRFAASQGPALLGAGWAPVQAQLRAGASSWQGIFNMAQQPLLAVLFADDTEPGMYEMVAVSAATVRADAAVRSLLIVALVTAALLLLWLMVLLWLRRLVTRPLGQLRDELVQSQRGKFSPTRVVYQSLEVSALSVQLHQLSDSMAAELRQRSRSLLRQRRDADNQRALVAMLETSLGEQGLDGKLARILTLLAERIEHPALLAARIQRVLPQRQVLAERGSTELLPTDVEASPDDGWRQLEGRRYGVLPLTHGASIVGYLALLQPDEGEPPEAHFVRSVGHIIAAIMHREQQQMDLRRNESQMRTILDHVADGLVVHDEQGQIIRANLTLTQLSGYSREELLGMRLSQLLDTDPGQLDGDAPRGVALRHRQGRQIPAELSTAGFGAEGRELQVSLVRDISQRLDAELQLRMLSQVVEQSPVAVVITDTRGVIEYVNPRFCRDSGYRPLELIGQHSRILRSGLTPQEVYRALWSRISQGAAWRGELCNRTKSGELFWERLLVCPISDGTHTSHYLALKENITTERRQRDQLFEQAHFDQLTGLPNRTQALDCLEQLIETETPASGAALLVLDLDHFKGVNESLGHGAGDQLLVAVSQRLRDLVAEPTTLSRLGGDEFAVIAAIADAADAGRLAQRLLDAFEQPFAVDEQHLFINLSIGIAVHPTDGVDAMALLRHAEAALNLAKSEGRGRYAVYQAEMNLQAQRRLVMETELRFALERNELRLHYQPQVELMGRAAGAEAMLRWESERLGPVAPDTFIPLAEKLGLIVAMGDWALRQACEDALSWQDDPLMPDCVAVNVSAKQLTDRGFVERVSAILDSSGLPPGCLELEITESILLANDLHTIDVLQRLHRLGVQLSLDDFGTGYSSLSYLQRYPFHTLKVDRVFVQEISDDPDSGKLIGAIVSMAKSLSLRVVAEGVETAEQLDFVHSLGCDLVQGFYYAGPQPLSRLRRYLETHHQRHLSR